MNPNANNTIFMTGGTSGIGRALAEAFHTLGNHVIISGRRKNLLDEVTAANPGMAAELLDVSNPADLSRLAADLPGKYPGMNVLIHMAGIMKPESLLETADPATINDIIATNLIAPLQLTGALLPHLKRQPHATIMTVTSGLAFTPLAITPTYCATKAAMHSYSLSLRYQLRDTNVEVLELAPPYVQTELMGPGMAVDPRAMPLADFIAEVMDILTNQPDAKEILVKRVEPLRYAGDFNRDKYDAFFAQFNDAMAGH
jgi:uncharacterized oxidoreductase